VKTFISHLEILTSNLSIAFSWASWNIFTFILYHVLDGGELPYILLVL